MIRSFGRNGVVERSLVSRHPPASISPRYIYLRRDLHGLSVISSQHRALLLHRHLSTSPSPPPSTTGKSSSPIPEPPHPAPRKPKVELRPAPVKPPPKASTPAPPLARGEPEKAPAPPVQAEDSLIEVTRRDLRDAQLHGLLIPPPANAGRVGRLFHQAKELFKFYWRGLKLFYTHLKQVNEINARVKSGGAPKTRWETRFVQTFRRDAIKMVPFVVIVLVVEEIIPLIALYAPFMLPSTCIMPSQWERIERKRREKQRVYAEGMRHDLAAVRKADSLAAVPNGPPLLALCGVLSLSTFGPPPVRRWRIQRRLSAIAADDVLLKQEGMGERLTAPELLEALEERGIIGDGLDGKELKARLRWWLAAADQSEGDAAGRRVALVARSALGQFLS